MPSQSPDILDTLEATLPRNLKWIFAGMGAVAGYLYAVQQGSGTPASCIVAGAAIGFGILALSFMGMRLVKTVAILAVVLIVINFAVLIPLGYGDHLPEWIGAGHAAWQAILGASMRLFDHWAAGLRA